MLYTSLSLQLEICENCDVRETFPEFYYNPNIKKLWENAVFVPDANVLLDIFCYPPETSRALVKVLAYLKDQDRLWIPYQFAQEYLKNLPYVRQKIREDFKRNKKDLDTLSTGILNVLTSFNEVTDFDLDKPIKEMKAILQTIKEGLQEFRKKHEKRLDNDNLEVVVEDLLKGIIGSQFTDERLVEVYDEGALRFRLRQPPGFKDAGKDESRRYGDLIGWLQIISYVQGLETKLPIIMITSDSSGHDWFYKPALDGKTRGPRPELVEEMRTKANVDFYIHQTGESIELADKYLTLDERFSKTTIEGAKRPRRRSMSGDPLNSASYAALIGANNDLSLQAQAAMANLQPQLDLNKQIQETFKNLQPQVDINKQIQETFNNLQPQIDINKQIQEMFNNLQPQIDINKQIQETFKNLQPQIDINKQIQETFKNLQPQIDINKQIQQALANTQPDIGRRTQTKPASTSMSDLARNAREANLSSSKPVDSAGRSREILSAEEDESADKNDE